MSAREGEATERSEHHGKVIMLSIAAAVGGFLFGFDSSVINGAVDAIAVQFELNDALKVALKDPEFIKKQEGLGAVVVTDKRMDGPEHKKFVAAEIAKWSPIIKAAGVYAD